MMCTSERFYTALCRELQPAFDPRHIEAYIRLEHSTLDHLSREEFTFQAAIAAECIRTVGHEQAERCARSVGL
jgi:hypothetical protein